MDSKNTALKQGATTEDIQFHDDLSRSFYQHWLDRTIQYLRMSAAAFERQQFGLLRLKFRSYANA